MACAVALCAGAIALVKTRSDIHGFQTDFGIFHAAARVLVEGGDPYRGTLYMYPLPAAVAIAPLARLPMEWAAVVFVAASMGLCAFALTRDGYWRLPILASFPALVAMSAGQWAPLVLCAAIGSGYGWTAALKPTLGLAMLARRIDWKGATLAALVGIASLALNPRWPLEWLHAGQQLAGAKIHSIPVTVPGGLLLLLAALRWRTEDGRLLFVMALIPQSMFFYDQLALGLLARTFRQSLVISLYSYAVMAITYVFAPVALDTLAQNAEYVARVVVWLLYLPALAVVLRRGAPSVRVPEPRPQTAEPA